MGAIKELYIRIQEDRKFRRLSKILGISEEDLELLDWEIHENFNNDGTRIYGYTIEFSDVCPKEVLNKIEILSDGRFVYLSSLEYDEEGYDDFEDDELELEWLLRDNTNQMSVFKNQIRCVDHLLSISFEGSIRFNILVMLHAHIVAATERFISSSLIREVTSSRQLLRKLVESDPELAKRKFTLNNIFIEHDKIELTISRYLKSLIYHRLDIIKPMLLDVLDYELGDVSWLFKAISIRHDCAHRAGLQLDGQQVDISEESIKLLVSNCIQLIEDLNQHMLDYKNDPLDDELTF